jgi:hypothetical protein
MALGNGNGDRAPVGGIGGQGTRVVPADLLAPYQPYQGGPSGPRVDRSLQVYLPEVFPIPAATEFNTVVSKATSVVETNIDIGLVIDLPQNNIGIIRGVNLFITNMLTTTNLTWTLTFNGAPVPGYSNLSIFPRLAPFVSNSFDSFIRIPQGNPMKVRIVYSNNDGGTYTIGAGLSGWNWPIQLGNLWTQQGPTG